MNTRNRHSGFTLIEILVVIAIMGVVTTLGTMVFSRMWAGWRTLQVRAEMDKRAADVVDQIRKDIGSVLSPTLSAAALLGERGEAEGMASDQLVIPVQIPLADNSQIRSASIRYAVERGKGSPTLTRCQGALGEASPGGAPVVVAEDVTQFRVEFLPRGEDQQWRSEWKERRLPALVRVSVTAAPPGRPGDAMTRVAVFRTPVNG